MVVNKVQSLKLFAYCCGRKKLSFQLLVVPHRTAVPAPHELPQLSSLLLQPLCFWVLPCAAVATTTASNLLSVPQKTLRNVGIYLEVGKDTFGNGNKPFWGGIMSCMVLTQSRMAAANTRNSPGIEAPASLLTFSPRQLVCAVTDTLLRGLSARPELNHLLYPTRAGGQTRPAGKTQHFPKKHKWDNMSYILHLSGYPSW